MKLRLCLPVLISAAATVAVAQPNRIVSRIDNSRRVILAGHVHRQANAANDAGGVESGFPIPFLALQLKPSAAQQADLDQLLADQLNPASPSFHKWLTPEEYADRFGASAADTAQIVSWLQSQGFDVHPLSRSRTYITFSGNASQVEASLGTPIHRYRVNGEMHFANSSDPKIPVALASVVAGFRGLSDFHAKPHTARAPQAHWTSAPFGPVYSVAPDDFAAIYDVTPMYTAGIDGTGQSIAIVGQSQLYQNGADVMSFWNKFGISAKLTIKQVPRTSNPGLVSGGGVDEASLDTEWAGAVARGATIVFVYSPDAWVSAQYIVDQNLAPVLSMSLGLCEAMEGLTQLPIDRQIVLQANAQGITWLAASGDSGAMDCDNSDSVASGGLTVDSPGSIPEVVSMGGTQLAANVRYWNNSNSATFASAKGYVPETVWNDTNAAGAILGSGGGASGFFTQPPWQAGIVPDDGWRHVPDISLNSSVYGVPYYVQCSSSQCFSGLSSGIEYLGGTSMAAPTMAGVVALLNQYLKTNGVGNINPALYALSRDSNAYASVFHDITSGNNSGPCAYASPGCPGSGIQGYNAGQGYDSATGLGSVDVTNLIQQWHSFAPTGAVVTPSTDQNPITQGASPSCGGNQSEWNFRLTLTEAAGFGATVTGFKINGIDLSSKISTIFGTTSIDARKSISGCYSLASVTVPANETFTFSGKDTSGNPWSSAMTIPFQGPLSKLSVSGGTNAASYKQVFAPGMLMSVFGAGMGTFEQSASTIPLPEFMAGFQGYINGYPAPLYYVGPNQVNLQIPYEVTGSAQLVLYTPYQPFGITYNFSVATTAPGIFTFLDGSNDVNPSRTGKAGDVVFLYITGEGKTTPNIADGDTPNAGTPLSFLPKPRLAVSMTVAGLPVDTTDSNWFIGIPSGLVGVTQINFKIPAGVPKGRQPVVVTVGTVSSPPAFITIQ